MSNIQIGCGQLTWSGMSEDDVLAEIATAGYDGAPGGIRADRSPKETIAVFAEHGLVPAPPYFSGRFWVPDEEDRLLGAATTAARYVRGLGLTELYVATEGFADTFPNGKTRAEIAGQVTEADALTSQQFDHFGRLLSEFGRRTLAEGVASCFHNHVGTVIETAWELDQLLQRCDDSAVFLGLDTGHIAWAGDDAAAVCARYDGRIRTLHLKDVDPIVRDRGVAEGWGYMAFNDGGVFAELGEGCVDFPAIIDRLRARDFSGWLIVETDKTMKATALESALISRQYLQSLGL